MAEHPQFQENLIPEYGYEKLYGQDSHAEVSGADTANEDIHAALQLASLHNQPVAVVPDNAREPQQYENTSSPVTQVHVKEHPHEENNEPEQTQDGVEGVAEDQGGVEGEDEDEDGVEGVTEDLEGEVEDEGKETSSTKAANASEDEHEKYDNDDSGSENSAEVEVKIENPSDDEDKVNNESEPDIDYDLEYNDNEDRDGSDDSDFSPVRKKRKSRRSRKMVIYDDEMLDDDDDLSIDERAEKKKTKKKRGRPRKNSSDRSRSPKPKKSKKRGRPRKPSSEKSPAKSKPKIYTQLCDLCDKHFKTELTLKKHLLDVHTTRPGSKKDLERKAEKLANDANSGVVRKRGRPRTRVPGTPKEKKHLCTTCGRACVSNSALLIHMNIHTREVKFTCEHCNKTYSTKSCLQTHVKSAHEGERPCKCGYCPEAFKTIQQLLRHIKMHSRQYQCNECPATFSARSSLYRHRQNHKQEKNYVCHQCKKWFTRKAGLDRHMRIHINYRPYRCRLCDKKFIQRVHFLSHFAVHRKKLIKKGEPIPDLNESLETDIRPQVHELIRKTSLVGKKPKTKRSKNKNAPPAVPPVVIDNNQVQTHQIHQVDNTGPVQNIVIHFQDEDEAANALFSLERTIGPDANSGDVNYVLTPQNVNNAPREYPLTFEGLMDAVATQSQLEPQHLQVGTIHQQPNQAPIQGNSIQQHLAPNTMQIQQHYHPSTSNVQYNLPNLPNLPNLQSLPNHPSYQFHYFDQSHVHLQNPLPSSSQWRPNFDNPHLNQGLPQQMVQQQQQQQQPIYQDPMRFIPTNQQHEQQPHTQINNLPADMSMQQQQYNPPQQPPKEKKKRVRKNPSDPNAPKTPRQKRTGEQRSWICDICQKVFTAFATLNRHKKMSHLKEKPFPCEVCPKRFGRKELLKNHMMIHTDARPCQCRFCPLKFRQNTHLIRHERLHTGEKPYKCTWDKEGEKCEKAFADSGALTAHMRTHTGEKPWICPDCGKGAGSKKDLATHMRIHTGEKPFKCEHCGHAFRQKSNYRTHILKHHTPRKEGEEPPPKKPKKPKAPGEPKKRGRPRKIVVKVEKPRPFACELCECKFQFKANLLRHLKNHTGKEEKPYICRLCDKKLFNKASLKQHLYTHDKLRDAPKPFTCEVCEKPCSTPGDLKIHMRVHTGERPYKCTACDKAFTQRGNLKSHQAKAHPGIDLTKTVHEPLENEGENQCDKNTDTTNMNTSMDSTSQNATENHLIQENHQSADNNHQENPPHHQDELHLHSAEQQHHIAVEQQQQHIVEQHIVVEQNGNSSHHPNHDNSTNDEVAMLMEGSTFHSTIPLNLQASVLHPHQQHH